MFICYAYSKPRKSAVNQDGTGTTGRSAWFETPDIEEAHRWCQSKVEACGYTCASIKEVK